MNKNNFFDKLILFTVIIIIFYVAILIYSDINEILTYINKHYSQDETARKLFKTIEADLFHRSIGISIKLKPKRKKK